ncbi:MAG: hydrogenase nickel incorporation protein HypB [Afipia sp.]|nr:hydrogenase nickel incorporation protein HypB [Afipia sp.]
MCGHCGCGSKTGATILNLQTGKEIDMSSHSHDHDHIHEDGTRHSHGHSHSHDHHHDQPHGHTHAHADGTRHSHSHDHSDGDHDHTHDPDHHHSHDHVHSDGVRHSHSHDHEHGHSHAHGHDHSHGDDTRHSHSHDHGDHDHDHHGNHGHEHTNHHHATDAVMELETRILAKNDALATKNRAWFAGREILALNLVSSPGSGKTTLLERTIRDMKITTKLYVLEGDQATANDGERIRAAGAPAVQVNTGAGCHLEADMVARGLVELKPESGSIVMIENVGNLVCPAMFDLGESAKVVILSVTEGEDKPLKYPHMFRAAELMILNKIDLLPHVDFDVSRAIANAREVNPDIIILQVSARSGEGLETWYDWLRHEVGQAREAAFA